MSTGLNPSSTLAGNLVLIGIRGVALGDSDLSPAGRSVTPENT